MTLPSKVKNIAHIVIKDNDQYPSLCITTFAGILRCAALASINHYILNGHE